MKHFLLMLFVMSFSGSFAFAASEAIGTGEASGAICPALLEQNTRTMGKSPSDITIKLPTKSGSTAQ